MHPLFIVTALSALLLLPGCTTDQGSSLGRVTEVIVSYPYQGNVSEIHTEFERALFHELRSLGIAFTRQGYMHMSIYVSHKDASRSRRVALKIRQSCLKRYPESRDEVEQIKVYRRKA